MPPRRHDGEEEDGGGIMGSILFGNIDEEGRADVDYLDEDAKQNLGSIAAQLGKEDNLAQVKARVDRTQKSLSKHGTPAIILATLPARLTRDDLIHFHRPRAVRDGAGRNALDIGFPQHKELPWRLLGGWPLAPLSPHTHLAEAGINKPQNHLYVLLPALRLVSRPHLPEPGQPLKPPSAFSTKASLTGPENTPFYTPLPPGLTVLCVDTHMFKAPAAPHDPRPSDFLLVRAPHGFVQLRELTGTLTVGQQHPHERVPDPWDAEWIKGYNGNRVFVAVARALQRKEKQNPAAKPFVTLKEISDQLPGIPREEEAKLREMLRPDVVCAYESMRAAELRLKGLGLGHVQHLTEVARNEPERWQAAADWNRVTGRPESLKEKPPAEGSITGTDADLRKLGHEEAGRMLMGWGVKKEVVDSMTNRWRRIDLVRKLATQAALEGTEGFNQHYDEEERRAYAELAREGFLGAGGDKAAGGKPKKGGPLEAKAKDRRIRRTLELLGPPDPDTGVPAVVGRRELLYRDRMEMQTVNRGLNRGEQGGFGQAVLHPPASNFMPGPYVMRRMAAGTTRRAGKPRPEPKEEAAKEAKEAKPPKERKPRPPRDPNAPPKPRKPAAPRVKQQANAMPQLH
eukprot:XP_001702733.1 TafII-250 protein [Chlamydomonas reinhardtii]